MTTWQTVAIGPAGLPLDHPPLIPTILVGNLIGYAVRSVSPGSSRFRGGISRPEGQRGGGHGHRSNEGPQ